MGVTPVSEKQVKISYTRGDLVETTPRQVDVYITCSPDGGLLSFNNFSEPNVVNPPPPSYIFSLYLSSAAICSPSAYCSLQGYHFNYISAIKNWSSSWTPPGGTQETIAYAPCSNGISSGCGSQCANRADCCAVCQSWKTDTGSDSACLGLSNNLRDVTAISNIGVKITYGGGDHVGQSERRVDVVILCDPEAELLTFVDFIPPKPQNPPPPFYEYVLVLSSNDLCGPQDNIEQFLQKYLH
jgi:hypothetical protein